MVGAAGLRDRGWRDARHPAGSPGHSPVLPSRFPHVSCSRVTQPFPSRVQSLRWVWKLQGPPLTKDRLCGRPPGEITAGGGAGRNPLPPRLWAVTAQSQAPEGAPGREPVSSYNSSCLAPVEPVTRWPVLLGLHLGQRTRDALHLAVLLTQGRPQCSGSALQRWRPGAWGVDGRGGSLSSPTSQSLKSPTQPEESPGQQGQLFFWGLSFLQSNCLCYILTPCAVTSEHLECLPCARIVFCRLSGYVRGARPTQHREPACDWEPPVFPTRFTQVIVRCSPGSRSRGWTGNHVVPTGAGCSGWPAGPSHPLPATQSGHELFLQEDKG